MEFEEVAVPAGFVAGPLGTRKERIILSEGHQPEEFYTNTSYHFTVCYWQSQTSKYAKSQNDEEVLCSGTNWTTTVVKIVENKCGRF